MWLYYQQVVTLLCLHLWSTANSDIPSTLIHSPSMKYLERAIGLKFHWVEPLFHHDAGRCTHAKSLPRCLQLCYTANSDIPSTRIPWVACLNSDITLKSTLLYMQLCCTCNCPIKTRILDAGAECKTLFIKTGFTYLLAWRCLTNQDGTSEQG